MSLNPLQQLPWNLLEQLFRQAIQEQLPVLFIVNDPERPTRSDRVLKTMFERIRSPYPELHLLIATGSHVFHEKERDFFEQQMFGAVRERFVSIVWHTPQSAVVSLEDGVEINKHVLNFSYWVLIGSLEPHYFSGITGAHKTLAIGCTSLEALRVNHELALHPQSRPLKLQGNPVFEDQRRRYEKIRERAKQVLAIQLLQDQEKLTACALGDALATLYQLLPQAEKQFCRALDAPLSLLLLTVDGPLGVSIYQAEKAIKNNEWAVANQGRIVLSAPCSKGIGPERFLRLLHQYSSYDQASVSLGRYQLGDHKALKLLYLTDPHYRGVKLYLYSSGVTEVQAKTVRMQKISEDEWNVFLKHPDAYLLEHADQYILNFSQERI